MHLHDFSKTNSLLQQFVAELRDVQIQKDRMRFRKNLERIGEIIGYEISKILEWENYEVTTPLGVANCKRLVEQPILATILRAGLPLHQGMLQVFDQADNAFIAAYRKHDSEETFTINLEYFTSPSLNNRILILCDPMLATGQSIVQTIKKLAVVGKPKHIHIVSAIASAEGIEYIKNHLVGVTVWAGAVDEELTAKAYIVPGLGDAGDLCFGEKMQD
jgi:uracil phosphoribosyltransferase